jgi:predicted alpha/beta hydrolase
MRSNTTIRTNDGTRIWVSSYSPQESNGKIIVIAPGAGCTQEYYDAFANHLCSSGFIVISFDYRGVGRSAPEKLNGFNASMYQWAVQDINAVLLFAKHQYPKQEIIYIGHSTGGEIIGLAPASQYIHKLILISSSLSCAKLWPWQYRMGLDSLKFFGRISSRIFGYFPGKSFYIYGDLPKGVIYEWANWCDSSNGLFDSFPDNNYRKLNAPILAFSFTDDWRCSPRAVKGLINKFENSTITWYHIDPKEIGMKKIGHIDFFRPAMKAKLWNELLKWLNKDEQVSKDKKIVIIKRYLNE